MVVEMFDPVQKIQLSYHIDKNILKKWDNLKGGKLIKTDDDRVYIVDGRERTGKSVFTFQQAKYLDPTFDVSRVCFTPDEFLHKIRTAEKGQCIVFDEAFRGLSSKGSQSKVNKKLVQAMMEMGQRNLIVFIVLPTIFLLELYAAVLRSHALFHIFKDKNGQRRVRVYNYQKKSLLYLNGKKKGFSYRFPKVPFSGRFFNKYTINETEYRKKKAESFEKSDIIKEEEDDRISIERRILIELACQLHKKYIKKSDEFYTKTLNMNNINIGRSMIVENRSYLRKKGINVICHMT